MSPFDISQTHHLMLLCGAASIAGFVRGFAGFGGPATVSLLLANFFAPATLLPKIALLDCYAFPMLLWNVRRGAEWSVSLPMAAMTIGVLPLGIYTMQTLDPVVLKRLIGAACLLAVLVAMIGFRLPRVPPLWVNLPVAGLFGWLLGTTYIALPIVTYFLLMPLAAVVCRVTVISYSVLITPVLVALLFINGAVQLSDVLPVALAGVTYFSLVGVGSWAFGKASARNYRRAAQWLLLVLAVTVLV